MKTITMPLDEYNKEIKDLTESMERRSYTKGALAMADLIHERLVLGKVDSHFMNNPEATKALTDLIREIKVVQSVGKILNGK